MIADKIGFSIVTNNWLLLDNYSHKQSVVVSCIEATMPVVEGGHRQLHISLCVYVSVLPWTMRRDSSSSMVSNVIYQKVHRCLYNTCSCHCLYHKMQLWVCVCTKEEIQCKLCFGNLQLARGDNSLVGMQPVSQYTTRTVCPCPLLQKLGLGQSGRLAFGARQTKQPLGRVSIRELSSKLPT